MSFLMLHQLIQSSNLGLVFLDQRLLLQPHLLRLLERPQQLRLVCLQLLHLPLQDLVVLYPLGALLHLLLQKLLFLPGCTQTLLAK